MYLYSKFTATKTACCIGIMVGCVFGYFADCTVDTLPLFILIIITILLLCRNVGVGMLRFGWSSMSVITDGLVMAEEPTFHNVFRLPVNKIVPKIRSHFINKQRHPFSSLTWCCALLLHKRGYTRKDMSCRSWVLYQIICYR